MSSSSQKKHNPHKKRVEIADSTGWTHVVRGQRSRINPNSNSQDIERRLRQLKSDKSLDIDQLIQSFARLDQQWRSSTCAFELRAILNEIVIPSLHHQPESSLFPISKCICLGLGRLSNSNLTSSKYELAALFSILEVLLPNKPPSPEQPDPSGKSESKGGSETTPFDIIVQDPAFTPTDIDFLNEHATSLIPSQSLAANYKITILQTPASFHLIDSTTFLFAPHLEHSIFALALEAAKGFPLLCIANSDLNDVSQSSFSGNVVSLIDHNDNNGRRRRNGDGESNRERDDNVVSEFANSRTSRPMPDFDRDTWCHFTSIYWPVQPSKSMP